MAPSRRLQDFAPLQLLLYALFCSSAAGGETGDAAGTSKQDARSLSLPPVDTRWTFFNTLTGVRQDEDPGGAPYIDERGQRHWVGTDGQWQDDPGPGPVNVDYRFLWVELWSAEAERVYYFNQETQTTSWDRPVDLAWIRLPADVAIGEPLESVDTSSSSSSSSELGRAETGSAGSDIPGGSSEQGGNLASRAAQGEAADGADVQESSKEASS